MTASVAVGFASQTGSPAAIRMPKRMIPGTRDLSTITPPTFQTFRQRSVTFNMPTYAPRHTSGLLRSSIGITNSPVMTEPDVAISPVTSALAVAAAAGFVGGCVWAIAQPNSAAGLVAAASIFILVFIGKAHKKKLDEARQHHR